MTLEASGAQSGGRFETVHTRTMKECFDDPFVIMLFNKEETDKKLMPNLVGSALYGHVIAGDIFFARAIGEDITAPDDVEEIKSKLMRIFTCLKEK